VAKAANARPEVKAKINAYNARPEVKDRQNVAHKASWESPRHGWNKKTGRLDWGAGEYRKEQKKWRKRSKRRLLKFQENAI